MLVANVFCVVVGFFGATINGMTGFGAGVILLGAWSIAHMFGLPGTENLVLPVTLSTVGSPLTNMGLALVDLRYVNWKLFSVLTLGLAITWPIGILAFVRLPTSSLKTTLGVVCLVFALWRLWVIYGEFNQLSKTHELISLGPFPHTEQRSLLPELSSSSAPPDFGVISTSSNVQNTDTHPLPSFQETSIQQHRDACQPKSEDEAIVASLVELRIMEQKIVEAGEERRSTDDWRGETVTTTTNPKPTALSPKQCVVSFVAALVSGFFGGAYGIPGPALMSLFSWLSLYKLETRGTSCLALSLIIPLRFYLMIKEGLIVASDMPLYIVFCVTYACGLALGNRLTQRVNTKIVILVILSVLVIASISYIDFGNRFVTSALVCAVFLVILGVWTVSYRRCLVVFASHH